MKFKIYKSRGEWRFRIVARNGKCIASGEGYKNKSDCLSTVQQIRQWAHEAEVIDMSVKVAKEGVIA